MSQGAVSAFRAFDFEGNSKWNEYLAKVEITGSDYESQIEKLRAKWYKREIDPNFDISLLRNKNPEQSRPNSAPTTSSASRPVDNRARAETSMLLIHLAVLILGVLSFLPLIPTAIHRYFFQASFLAHMLKIVKTFGMPAPLTSLAAIKQWASRALPSTDFQYACLSLLFWVRTPTRMVFIPSTTLALYHVAHISSIRFGNYGIWKKYLASYHTYLKNRTAQALLLNAAAEIATGLFILFQLITPQRNLVLIVIYWQWLRIRYFSVDAAENHRRVWATIGLKCDPLLNSMPILKVPIKYAKQWFLNLQQQTR